MDHTTNIPKLKTHNNINKWIKSKTETVKDLSIYTHKTCYNKLTNHRDPQQILKQLHHKLHQILRGLQDTDTETQIMQQLNRLIPNKTFSCKPRPDIEEDHIDFMQAYNLRNKSDTTTTTKLSEMGTHITNLKILSRNINGKVAKRLQPDAALMIDIILHEPHIIVIQEHQHELLNTTAFRRLAQIKGYQLVIHAKARRNEDGTGRPSGGLATWIHNSIVNAYNIQRMINA